MDLDHDLGTIVATLTLILRDGDDEHRVTMADGGVFSADGKDAIAARRTGPGVIRIGDDPVRTAWAAAVGDARWVFFDGEVYELEVEPEGRRRRTGGHAGSLSAPMPATVIHLQVRSGDAVKRGDTLVILEAMKMELPVRAPADGTVKAVHCRQGDLVQPGVPLIEMA